MKVKVKPLSRVWLFGTPWTVAYQAPLSRGFSRQEWWSGLPFPSPGDLPDPGIEPRSPILQEDALLSEPPGKPRSIILQLKKRIFELGYLIVLLWGGQKLFLPKIWSLSLEFVNVLPYYVLGFPGGSDGKVSACNAGNMGLIPGSGRSPGEGYGNPLQYSCLENTMDRGAWRATVHGVTSQTWLSDWTELNNFLCKLSHDLW